MKKRMNVGKVALAAALATGAAYAQIQQAGNLLVDINAQSQGLGNGAAVPSIANGGTLGGTFFPVSAASSVVFSTGIAGAKAFTFNGAVGSVMTNSVLPPSSICGGNVWSMEAWVYKPSAPGTETYFTWTRRGNPPGGNSDRTCVEFRYSSDVNNAVEHYGGGNNLVWSGAYPAVGQWHHIVVVRSASGMEWLYRDTVLQDTKTVNLIARTDGWFTLGGVFQDSNWTMFFNGSIGALRLHSGTLPVSAIVNNYVTERGTYGQSTPPDISIWTGAAGTLLPWSDPANWFAGAVGGGNTVTLDNGGFASLTAALAPLKSLTAPNGKLVMTGGAALAVNTATVVGSGGGANRFDLEVTEGTFAVNSTFALGINTPATLKVGGGAGPAEFRVLSEMFLGETSAVGGIPHAPTLVTVLTNGTFIHSNSWFRIGRNTNDVSVFTVEEGGRVVHMTGSGVAVGSQGANGSLVMNGGLFQVRSGYLMMSEWVVGTAELHLNGGRLEARYINDNNAAMSTIFFNGGVLAPYDTSSTNNFIQNVKRLYIQEGGAVFDVSVPSLAVNRTFEDAPGVASSGGIVKLGPGDLRLTSSNAFTGPITVEGGSLLLQNANALPAAYAGTVTLTNNALIACQQAGGAGILARNMSADSQGRLGLYAANANDTINLAHAPGVTVEFLGDFTFTGQIIPYQNSFSFTPLTTNFTYAGTIADVPGYPATVTVETNTPTAGRLILATANAFTGAVNINGGTLEMRHTGALGSGRNITLRNFAALKLNAAGLPSNFVDSRITPNSEGVILLGPACAGLDLDLRGYPGLFVGTDETALAYTGTLTPDGTTYRLGGGNLAYANSNTGLNIDGLCNDGATPREVLVGRPGLVYLKNNNTHSGGTRIESGGVAYIASDSAFGAVPPSYDAQNIALDGGVLRCGNANVTLHANRGVAIRSGGGTFHTWSGIRLAVTGSLSGTGKLSLTDYGTLQLAGPNNTFNGPVEFPMNQSNAGTLEIGNGPVYSWASTMPMSGTLRGANVVLNNDAAASFAAPMSGVMGLVKRGAGVMDLASSGNTYVYDTRIEAGTLRLAANNALPYGVGMSNVEIRASAALDINGRDVNINGLLGGGLVTNTQASVNALRVGNNNGNSTFLGTTADNVQLTKVGSGYHLDAGATPLTSPASAAGALEITGPGRILTQATVAPGASVRFKTDDALPVGAGPNTLTVPAAGSAGSMAEKTGLSTLTLLSDNTAFAGLWAVRSGILCVGNGGTAGILGGSGVTTDAGATLAFNRADSVTLGIPVSGAGGLWQEGSGMLTLSATNTYTGGTTIEAGTTLRVLSPGTLGGGALTNNGTLLFDLDATYIQSFTAPFSPLAGNGEIVITSGAMLMDRLLPDTLTVRNGGAVILPDAADTSALTVDLKNGGTVGMGFGTSAPMAVMGDAALWQLNGNATWITTGQRLRMTANTGNQVGSVFLKQAIPSDLPWEISFDYEVGAHTANGNPADGFFVFMHGNATTGNTAIGGTGGNRGYLTSSNVTPSAGFGLSIYVNANDSCNFTWAQNAAALGTAVKATGINPRPDLNKGILTVSLAYDGINTLTATLTQGATVFRTNMTANVATILGRNTGWLGFTASTGGSSAEQFITNLKVYSKSMGATHGATLNVAAAASSTLSLDFSPNATFVTETLVLNEGSALTVTPSANVPSGTAYTAVFNNVILNGAASLGIAGNGTLGFKTWFADAISRVTLTGPVILPDGALTVIVPEDLRYGTYVLADVSGATGIGSTTVFNLIGPPDAKVFYRNGRIILSRPGGTVLILR